VTNNHVIEEATKLKVKLNDGRLFDAKLIGTDPTTDVALIKIEGEDLPTLPFGDSDDLRLGEWVLAIGSPFNLQSTITAGIVSAKARQLGVIAEEAPIESFIQTDAAVNPGNSGGALVNTRGELVGINTVIKSSTGSYIGYSFAVPETIVRKVVMDLKEYGVVQRAMLGVRYRAIDDQFIEEQGEELGIKKTGGLYVFSVEEGSAAAEAGLRKGDIITAIDGVKTNDASVLLEKIAQKRPNDKVTISFDRNGSDKKVDVVLKNRVGKAEPVTRDTMDIAEALGGKFAEVNERMCQKLEIRGGVQVVSIKRDGLLGRSGVKEGFVITYINDRLVTSISDLQRMSDKVQTIDGVYPNGQAVRYVIVQ
jgi:S1-C subfamily serine protease